jgi:hypothetical protein
MKWMSLALVLAAAVGSFGTEGFAQAAGTQQATASHVSKAHAARTHAVMVRQKSAKTVRAHKAVLPKSWAPKGTADGIYSFTG